jgi:hypothetical protein
MRRGLLKGLRSLFLRKKEKGERRKVKQMPNATINLRFYIITTQVESSFELLQITWKLPSPVTWPSL